MISKQSTTAMTTDEVALLLHGLRSIYVADKDKDCERMKRIFIEELLSRGIRLGESGEDRGCIAKGSVIEMAPGVYSLGIEEDHELFLRGIKG